MREHVGFMERLRLFNQKALRLKESRFQAALTKGLSAEVSVTMGETPTSDYKGPDAEAVQAAVVTLRQFIQDNADVSIGNLRRTYEAELPGSHACAEDHRVSKKLNDFLDGETPFSIGAQNAPTNIARRALLDAYIYGDLAHTKSKHRRTFSAFESSPYSNAVGRVEFVHVMAVVSKAAQLLADINGRVLADMIRDP